jgi:hypothetical protein
MRKTLVALAVAVTSVFTILPAAPASASTCEIGEDTVHGVVCVLVMDPLTRAACTVVEKAKLDCLR